jgi:hypothetical protein
LSQRFSRAESFEKTGILPWMLSLWDLFQLTMHAGSISAVVLVSMSITLPGDAGFAGIQNKVFHSDFRRTPGRLGSAWNGGVPMNIQ